MKNHYENIKAASTSGVLSNETVLPLNNSDGALNDTFILDYSFYADSVVDDMLTSLENMPENIKIVIVNNIARQSISDFDDTQFKRFCDALTNRQLDKLEAEHFFPEPLLRKKFRQNYVDHSGSLKFWKQDEHEYWCTRDLYVIKSYFNLTAALKQNTSLEGISLLRADELEDLANSAPQYLQDVYIMNNRDLSFINEHFDTFVKFIPNLKTIRTDNTYFFDSTVLAEIRDKMERYLIEIPKALYELETKKRKPENTNELKRSLPRDVVNCIAQFFPYVTERELKIMQQENQQVSEQMVGIQPGL